MANLPRGRTTTVANYCQFTPVFVSLPVPNVPGITSLSWLLNTQQLCFGAARFLIKLWADLSARIGVTIGSI